MKAYIGNYTFRWVSNIHDKYMRKKYGPSWNENKDYKDRFVEKIETTLQFVYNKTINRFLDNKKRVIKIKIHDYDVWDAGHTIALIALPLLEKLKETKHGAPYVDDEDVPENLRTTSAPELTEDEKNMGGIDDNFFARWEYVLDEMIFAFKNKVDDEWENQFYSGEVDWKFEKVEGEYSRLTHGPNHTFKVDREGKKKYYERIKNGYRLFGKYYDALWD
jgi:hypothetical protein